jgi:hypothetical protein
MYTQSLYNIIEPVKINTIKRLNKSKKWNYGYNKENDIIVISKTGQIGEIYQIQNLRIALPPAPKNIKKENNKWEVHEYPKELSKLKTIFDWKDLPTDFKNKWHGYIDKEFTKRDEGYWFYNKGNPTYITGAHYMYLQWTKIDVGKPEFREANRLFFIFWEACKADNRCYGMCYLKNRRSGFSFMASSETVNQATISSDSRYGILSKSGADAKKMFTDKVVPISVNYPFFFKPIQDGMDRPKTELAYRVPASKFTRRKIIVNEKTEELAGLDTTIDWKNTGDNSYDGEKLALLVHDEAGKWERPENILNNWRVTKTTLRLGSRVIGKCMMGSTSNSLDKVEGLKGDQDGLNEFYRQFPRTEEHAFRDETRNSIFNLAKIYEQIDYNEESRYSALVTCGSFSWKNGVQDSKVEFTPNPNGRFNVSWVPEKHLQNKIIFKNGIKYPANDHIGAFGCDSYDISGTTDGKGSKGSLHGLTKFSMEDVPANMFFLEYIARPQTAEIFFEDILMALHFYGMPLLAENNKPRLLYYLKRRGYRGYSMNRPDKLWNKLSVTEKEIGGIPNSSEDIRQAHAAAIESYINTYVGLKHDGTYGDMYFNKTLNDWAKFDINKRTKFDAAISSGLAIMACNKNKYAPNAQRQLKKEVNFSFAKYNNKGNISKIIQ